MILLSCEHAGNKVPAAYQKLFSQCDNLLQSHRGWDPGALPVAQELSRLIDAKLFTYSYTRLLIEPNRSIHHKNLFSHLSKELPKPRKQDLIDNYYLPYRFKVEKAIEAALPSAIVWHFSIHSFTPELNGQVRNTDIGLLYDPSSNLEKEICLEVKNQLLHHSPYRVRLNYPYLGKADGFTTYLRRRFPVNYAGVEIEINQNLASANPTAVAGAIAEAIQQIYHPL
ncbi:N-formylglutamate amidohydrolase [Roseivirga sp. BDSF3-8]|uniref:N-formylglutamate amidohydrolase n=1 Tax=Roseivirga sp. BDSF3-8 TaxID=3241598 RepID=UPI00353202BB